MRLGTAIRLGMPPTYIPVPPPSSEIARFCQVVRLLNGDEEPAPDGPLGNVWAWLGKLGGAV
jgi:hypothetical protein